MMTQRNLKLTWTTLGAIAIATFPYIVEAIIGDLIAIPFYFLVLMLVIGPFSSSVFALLYIVYTSWIAESEEFGKMTFTIVLTIVVLNALFITQSLDDPLRYSSKSRIEMVLIINILCSISGLLFSFLGWRKNYINLQYAANLLLFFMLSWTAFPLMGGL